MAINYIRPGTYTQIDNSKAVPVSPAVFYYEPELPPFTASDNYGGVYPNSSTYQDSIYNARWAQNAGWTDGTVSINAGKLRYNLGQSGSYKIQGQNHRYEATGEFTAIIEISHAQFTAGNGLLDAYLRLHSAGETLISTIHTSKSNGDSGILFGILAGVPIQAVQITNAPATGIKFRMIRDALGDIRTWHDIGAGWSQSAGVDSYTGTAWIVLAADSSLTGTDSIIDFDNFTMVDGFGDPIPMTPPA